jgi:hypothetical protein
MNKNMFDPNMMKNLNEMMKSLQPNAYKNLTPKPTDIFQFGKLKKYIIALAGLLMLAGFGIGLLVGLMF